MADLVVARWDGAVWQDEGNDGAPTGKNANGTVTSAANVTNFSPFTLASISVNNPLPIELLGFNAFLNSNYVVLEWLTASEINNDYFTVERSKNGEDWESIIITDGAGYSSEEIKYLETDFRPYTALSYYRLKQTDYDGAFSYSETVAVNRNIETEFLVYPNPNTSGGPINILLPNEISNQNIDIIFRDISGKVIFSASVSDNNVKNSIVLNPESNFSIGTYVISVISENNAYHQKIVIE